jgi:outer membrane protein
MLFQLLMVMTWPSYSEGAKITLPHNLIQVLEIVKRRDNSLKASKYDVEAQKHQRLSQRGTLFPQLNLSTYTANTRNFADIYKKTTLITATASQVLFSMKDFEKYKIEKIKTKFQEFTYDGLESATFLSVINFLIEYKKFNLQSVNAQDNIENLKKHAAAIKKRYEIGEVTKSDVYKTKERLLNAKAEHQEFLLRKNNAQADFFELTQVMPDENFKLPIMDKFNRWYAVKHQTNKKLIHSNKGLAVLKSINSIDESNYKISKYTHLPNFSFFYQYDRELSHDSSAFKSRLEYKFGLKITLPLYSGSKDYYQERANKSSFMASKKIIENEVRKLDNQLSDGKRNIKALTQLVDIYSESRKISIKSLKGIEIEFLGGVKTSIDVLEGKQDLYETNKNYTIKRFELLAEQFNFLFLAGMLDIKNLSWLLQ